MSQHSTSQVAYFGLGCFWDPDIYFTELPGVISTEVGYMGGSLAQPSYEEVCNGTSGHTEVVKVTFDPDLISYRDLLYHFFDEHNPTQLFKRQYRSVIFYDSEEQRRDAESVKADLASEYDEPIVTAIEPAPEFYPAEEYHQKYLMKN